MSCDFEIRPIAVVRRVNVAAWAFGLVLHLLAAIQAVRFYVRNPRG